MVHDLKILDEIVAKTKPLLGKNTFGGDVPFRPNDKWFLQDYAMCYVLRNLIAGFNVSKGHPIGENFFMPVFNESSAQPLVDDLAEIKEAGQWSTEAISARPNGIQLHHIYKWGDMEIAIYFNQMALCLRWPSKHRGHADGLFYIPLPQYSSIEEHITYGEPTVRRFPEGRFEHITGFSDSINKTQARLNGMYWQQVVVPSSRQRPESLGANGLWEPGGAWPAEIAALVEQGRAMKVAEKIVDDGTCFVRRLMQLTAIIAALYADDLTVLQWLFNPVQGVHRHNQEDIVELSQIMDYLRASNYPFYYENSALVINGWDTSKTTLKIEPINILTTSYRQLSTFDKDDIWTISAIDDFSPRESFSGKKGLFMPIKRGEVMRKMLSIVRGELNRELKPTVSATYSGALWT